VPADIVIFTATDLTTDESSLTGETESCFKSVVTPDNYMHNPVPFVLAGTLVLSGEARGIVLAVGKNTRAGSAAQKMDIEADITPL
jgi:magnesium-transporting ATPase (P-type)